VHKRNALVWIVIVYSLGCPVLTQSVLMLTTREMQFVIKVKFPQKRQVFFGSWFHVLARKS